MCYFVIAEDSSDIWWRSGFPGGGFLHQGTVWAWAGLAHDWRDVSGVWFEHQGQAGLTSARRTVSGQDIRTSVSLRSIGKNFDTIFNARQRSVRLSVHRRGSHMTITHDAFDLSIEGHKTPSPTPPPTRDPLTMFKLVHYEATYGWQAVDLHPTGMYAAFKPRLHVPSTSPFFVSSIFHHRTALNPFLNGTKSVDFDSSVRVNEASFENVIWINFIATNINMCVLHFLRSLPTNSWKCKRSV